MAEKEAVLYSEDQDHDLHAIQTLLRQHEALEVRDTLSLRDLFQRQEVLW